MPDHCRGSDRLARRARIRGPSFWFTVTWRDRGCGRSASGGRRHWCSDPLCTDRSRRAAGGWRVLHEVRSHAAVHDGLSPSAPAARLAGLPTTRHSVSLVSYGFFDESPAVQHEGMPGDHAKW